MPGAAFRIHRLEIEGFKAFAAPQSFEIGGHVFVFGRNGLGKSSVVEAIRWCLFGLADRPEAEVRNVFYSAGECKVQLELEGPGGRWRIQRRLRPGSGRSDLAIQDPNGTTVPQSKVFPHMARLGPREGTHIIFASQQSSHRRPQADITNFDKVLYSYLQIDDVPDLLHRLDQELEEQAEIERKLAGEIDSAEESLRSELSGLHSRIEEILASAPWPGGSIPTNAETDARIRAFVEECGGSLECTDGDAVTRAWLLTEAERAIEELSVASKDAVERQLEAVQQSLEKTATAKQTYEALKEQVTKAQAVVQSGKHDLNNALGTATKEQLLREHNELVRQDNQLAQQLEFAQQATRYFEEFSPEECPVCDTSVRPTDVLARLQGRVTSDRRAAKLAEELKSIQERLQAVNTAEVALSAAEADHNAAESRAATARTKYMELLDDPVDLSSGERTIERLAERVRQLELELTQSGSLVAIKRNTMKNLRAEVRFQEYRYREERLRRNLEAGLQPAREAHREFIDVLETLRTIREALQESFNNALNQTLPQISELMTDVYGRLTQQASFPKIVVESGRPESRRTLHVRVASDRTPEESFVPSDVLNGQAFNALNLVPYFVFSQFQAEALELDCLLIDDPSQSFDTSRVELLMRELATAATHAQLIVASHEGDRFAPLIGKYFSSDSYRVLQVTSFAPDHGPTLERAD